MCIGPKGPQSTGELLPPPPNPSLWVQIWVCWWSIGGVVWVYFGMVIHTYKGWWSIGRMVWVVCFGLVICIYKGATLVGMLVVPMIWYHVRD